MVRIERKHDGGRRKTWTTPKKTSGRSTTEQRARGHRSTRSGVGQSPPIRFTYSVRPIFSPSTTPPNHHCCANVTPPNHCRRSHTTIKIDPGHKRARENWNTHTRSFAIHIHNIILYVSRWREYGSMLDNPRGPQPLNIIRPFYRAAAAQFPPRHHLRHLHNDHFYYAPFTMKKKKNKYQI